MLLTQSDRDDEVIITSNKSRAYRVYFNPVVPVTPVTILWPSLFPARAILRVCRPFKFHDSVTGLK